MSNRVAQLRDILSQWLSRRVAETQPLVADQLLLDKQLLCYKLLVSFAMVIWDHLHVSIEAQHGGLLPSLKV